MYILNKQTSRHGSWMRYINSGDGDNVIYCRNVNTIKKARKLCQTTLESEVSKARLKPGSGHVGFCDGQKWRWGRFPPRTSVSPANLHSICFFTIIFTITRGWHNRPGVGAVPIASQTRIKKSKATCMLMSRHQSTGQNRNKIIADRSFYFRKLTRTNIMFLQNDSDSPFFEPFSSRPQSLENKLESNTEL
jgi:hypothetical protein